MLYDSLVKLIIPFVAIVSITYLCFGSSLIQSLKLLGMRKPLGITTQGNSFFDGYHNVELRICSCLVVDLKYKNLGSNTNKLKYKTPERVPMSCITECLTSLQYL